MARLFLGEVRRALGDGVVGADDFEGFGVAGGSRQYQLLVFGTEVCCIYRDIWVAHGRRFKGRKKEKKN